MSADQPPRKKPRGQRKPIKQAKEVEPKETPEEPKAEEPTEQPSPEKPPQKKPPKTGKKLQGPLRDLLAAVDLPPMAAKPEPGGEGAEPIVLGQIHLKPGDSASSLEVRLLGGKEALKGKQMFDLLRDEAAGGSWRIRVAAEGAPTGDPAATEVARIWLDKETLKFAWCEFPAADRARAGSLRNCGLAISAGGPQRWLPLSRPKLVEPIALDFDRTPFRVPPLSLDSAPEPSTLRLQVTGLAGEVAKYKITPKNTIEPLDKSDPSKGTMNIRLSPPNLPRIDLRLAFDVTARAARIEVAPFIEIEEDVWRMLQIKELHSRIKTTKAAQETYEATAKSKGARGGEPARKAAQEQAKVLKAQWEQLQSLSDLLQLLRTGAKIHFRLFTVIDDSHRITLFTTTQATDTKSPAGVPAAR
jgi:hypothetical protein